jgi:hypothetical protein
MKHIHTAHTHTQQPTTFYFFRDVSSPRNGKTANRTVISARASRIKHVPLSLSRLTSTRSFRTQDRRGGLPNPISQLGSFAPVCSSGFSSGHARLSNRSWAAAHLYITNTKLHSTSTFPVQLNMIMHTRENLNYSVIIRLIVIYSTKSSRSAAAAVQ